MVQDAFEILNEVTEIEVIAKGRGIRRLQSLQQTLRWKTLAKAERPCYSPVGQRLDSASGGALVRGPRRWAEGMEDQTLSDPSYARRETAIKVRVMRPQ